MEASESKRKTMATQSSVTLRIADPEFRRRNRTSCLSWAKAPSQDITVGDCTSYRGRFKRTAVESTLILQAHKLVLRSVCQSPGQNRDRKSTRLNSSHV